jgi:hypothetical protein
MFLNCPAYMDNDGTTRCGLPAEVEYRYTLNSTDGPLESATIRCLAGHCFNGPIAFPAWERTDNHQPVTATMARYVGPTGTRDGRSPVGVAVIDGLGGRSQQIRRLNTSPAYYLGRPASIWITAMRPRRRRTASVA